MMENEELKVENACAEEAPGTLESEAPAVPECVPEAPEAAGEQEIKTAEEAAARRPNKAPMENLEIDGEINAPETRMTPEYLKFLEEQQKEMAAASALEESSRTIPVPEPEDERKKRVLTLQMDHQKQIIEENRRAWFGRRRRIRKDAEARLAELEKKFAELS